MVSKTVLYLTLVLQSNLGSGKPDADQHKFATLKPSYSSVLWKMK